MSTRKPVQNTNAPPIPMQDRAITVRLTDVIDEIVRHRLVVNQTVKNMLDTGKIAEDKRECAQCYLEGANAITNHIIESLMLSLNRPVIPTPPTTTDNNKEE